MPITIDYSDSATPQYVINVPRNYGTLVQTTPTEIRSVNIDQFRTDLNDLMDDAEGMPYPTNHQHFAPVTVSGTTLARVVLINDPYAVQFEDAQYNVNIVGGNSNIADKTIKNQVGINTANSAGLQDPFSLQAASYANEVTIDAANGEVGTTFPKGTRGAPVNNMADATFIAEQRGIVTIRVVGALALTSGDFSSGYTFQGDTYVTSSISISASANVEDCTFQNLAVTGTLDSNNTFRQCSVGTISVFEGRMLECGITGPVTLGSSGNCEIIDCFSEVAGGGPGQTPTLDMGTGANSDCIIRQYSGGLRVIDCTASVDVSFDFASGRCIFESSVTAGDFYVRGICEVTDNSAGSAEVRDQTITSISQQARIGAERAGTQRLS